MISDPAIAKQVSDVLIECYLKGVLFGCYPDERHQSQLRALIAPC